MESSEEKEEFPSTEQEVHRNTIADLHGKLAWGSLVHVAGSR
jgi:hypothetical protein